MPKRDYYDVLASVATPAMKKSKRLTASWPSIPSGQKSGRQIGRGKIQEIGEAYEALCDPQRRAAYDHYGHAAFDPARAPVAPVDSAAAFMIRLKSSAKFSAGRWYF